MNALDRMVGFRLDVWDFLTFASMMMVVVAAVSGWVWLAGLPGRIAIARKHPDAEAVKLMGYAGLLPTVFPWIQAFIWAFKPTDTVDIRRFPHEESKVIDAEIARLKGSAPSATPPPPSPAGSPSPPSAPPEGDGSSSPHQSTKP